MKKNKVKNVINIIKDMNIKDKLRLGICLSTSNWAKYKLVMFIMAKIMEMKQVERNKVVLYLFNKV